MDMTLTDGGIETRIIYEFRRPIGDFEAYKLLGDEAGRGILRRIYQSYAEVAVRYSLPIQLGTPTWRASRKWTHDVERVNTAAVELLRIVMKQYAGAGIILAGVIGPASDGYEAREALSADDAAAYLRDQAGVLAGLDVDLLYAPTFPAFSELSGVARSMAQTGRPYALIPMAAPERDDARWGATRRCNCPNRCRRLFNSASLHDWLPLPRTRPNGTASITGCAARAC
jgi:S-methylmethionine-dependent homocysteine/selenocysteine methylase